MISPDGTIHNQNGHNLIDKTWYSSTVDVPLLRGADSDSNNYLVVGKLDRDCK